MKTTHTLWRTAAITAATALALTLTPLAAHAAPPPLNTNALIDVTPSGGISNNVATWDPSLSADGRYVAFSSYATNLTSIPTLGMQQIYVRDMQTNTTRLISVGALGAGNDSSRSPSISDDGQTVMYISSASNLADGNSGGSQQALMWSAATGETTLVSATPGPVREAVDAEVIDVDLAGSGNAAVFETRAGNVVLNETPWDHKDRVYKWNRTSSTTLVADSPDTHATDASISDDGRYVAFRSITDITGAGTRWVQVYVRDTAVSTTRLLSKTAGGTYPGGEEPAISGDGRFVAFQANGADYGAPSSGPDQRIVVAEASTGVVRIVGDGLALPRYHAHEPTISADGGVVAYSTQYDYGTDPTAGQRYQVFSTVVATGGTTPVSQSRIRDYGNAPSHTPAISGNGRFVVFLSSATNLTVPAGGGYAQVLMRTIG